MSDEQVKPLAYVDSSAIVKLIQFEPESGELSSFLEGAALVSSRLGEIETRRAVRLAGASRATVERMETVLESMDVVEITPAIAKRAGTVGPPPLRTLDSIHLATALEIKEELEVMVVYDTRLRSAAAENGLATRSPGQA
jgi:predicted nucleic acid-binding protein